MTQAHTLLVCDDDPAVRDAYRGFFDHQDDLAVVGEARNGAEPPRRTPSCVPTRC